MFLAQMQNENHRLHNLLPAKKENYLCLRKINQYKHFNI